MAIIGQYPWHTDAFTQLQSMIAQHRLPNSLLITGIKHTGKLILAQRLIQLLLCQNQTKNQACGQCQSCLALASDDLSDEGSSKKLLTRQSLSPNVVYCRRELTLSGKLSEDVRIDQVREFCKTLQQTSDGLRIGVIWYGDEFNAASSDSLLKTLEEPPENTLIILLAHQKAHLSQTIVSRCHSVHIAPSSTQETQDWLKNNLDEKTLEQINLPSLLQSNHGAPLAVLSMIYSQQHQLYQAWQDYLLTLPKNLSLFSQGRPENITIALSCLRNLLMSLIRHQSISDTQTLEAKNQAIFDQIASKTQTHFLFALLDDVQAAIYLEHTQVNSLLLLDNILIVWAHISRLTTYPKLT